MDFKFFNLRSNPTRRLKAVFVDDDLFCHQIMKDLSENSPYVEIIAIFSSPKDFLKALPELDCDLYFLDIQMPEIKGFELCHHLKGKPFIFVTSVDGELREALSYSPVDILTKPISPERFKIAAKKAQEHFFNTLKKKEYLPFNSTKNKGKIFLKLDNIHLVTTSNEDARDKRFYMKNGDVHEIRRCNFDQILEHSDKLIQVNKRELVSIEVINTIENNIIILKDIKEKDAPKRIIIGAAYLPHLKEQLGI